MFHILRETEHSNTDIYRKQSTQIQTYTGSILSTQKIYRIVRHRTKKQMKQNTENRIQNTKHRKQNNGYTIHNTNKQENYVIKNKDYWIQKTENRTQKSKYRIRNTNKEQKIRNTEYRAQKTKYRVLNTEYWIQSTG